MRASGSRTLRCSALAPAFLALFAASAAAQSSTGVVQGQYQRFEQILQSRDAAGAVFERRLVREFLTQNYEFRNLSVLRPGLQLQSTLRYSELAYSHLPDASRTPQGSLRLNHRVFALSATYRPTSVTSGLGAAGVTAPGDTTRRITITSRAQETMLTGGWFPERGPRVDVTWTRQHRNPDLLGPGLYSTNRNARIGYERGNLRLHGMVGDLQRTPETPVRATRGQRTFSGGGNLTLAPFRATSVALQFDAADTRTRFPGNPTDVASTQSGSLQSAYRPNAVVGADLNYSVRNASHLNRARTSSIEQDGSLFLNITPRRSLRISTGGGARTVRQQDGTGVVRFLSAVVAGDGRVRPGWLGTASAAHTLNWDPQRGRFWTDAVRTGSRLRLARGLDADLSAQVSANSDTAARDQRWTTELGGRVIASPVRSFTISYGERTYRAGPSLGRSASRATTRTADLRWNLVSSLEMVGSYSRTGAATGDASHVSTRMAMVRWTAFRSWQVVGNWSRSEQERKSHFAEQLSGREIVGGRIAGALGRRLTISAGATVADPGEARESRQYDGSLTMTFGR